jgi:hypothetical protein
MTTIQKTITAVVIIVVLAFLTHWNIWNTYFQQDEWNGFGKVIYAQEYGYQTLVRLYGSHITPLSSLFFALLYNQFTLNYWQYAWYSIAMHIMNAILVYALARILFVKEHIAIIASSFFVTAYVSRQAVTWFAASASFLPAAFFSLLSLILFETFLKQKKSLYFFAALFFLVIGLGFRENVVFLFAYFIIRAYIVRPIMVKRVVVACLGIGSTYLLLRFSPFLLQSTPATADSFSTLSIQSIVAQAGEFIFVSLPQLVIPRLVGVSLGRWIFGQSYIPVDMGTVNIPLFIESIFIRVFYIGLWLLLVGIFIKTVRKVWNKEAVRNTLISLAFYLLISVLPFSFLPRDVFMESRHFYLSMIGFALVAAIMFDVYYQRASSVGKFLMLGCYFCVIYLNISSVQKFLNTSVKQKDTLTTVVDQVVKTYPEIPKKVIFFQEADPLSPQLGSGYMLMVLFHKKQPYYSFLKEDFLWDLTKQGYREVDGIGFGYFTQYDSLLDTFCNKDLSNENIFSFNWDQAQRILIDTTEQTRKGIRCNDNE